MADRDIEFIQGMWTGWKPAVTQLQLIEVDKAPWIIETAIDAWALDLDITQIAKAIRSYGGPMDKAEKRKLGLSQNVNFGIAYYDALTGKGKFDPVKSSKSIAHRIVQCGIWEGQKSQNEALEEGCLFLFHKCPNSCDWAKLTNGLYFHNRPTIPFQNCNKPNCSCGTSISKQPAEMGIVESIFAVIVFAGICLVLGYLGYLSRKHR
jgi:hypothetical protein